MKIAVLGGTFNPPHVGHAAVVNELHKHADEVWVMVANKPNKRAADLAPANARLAMASLAFKGAVVRADEIRRGGVSYTIDTLNELEAKYPERDFFWVIGSDLLAELPRWKNAGALCKEPFLVAFRPYVKIDYKKLAALHNARVFRFEGVEVSSTQLREWLKKKEYAKAKKFLSRSVFAYILKKKLYR